MTTPEARDREWALRELARALNVAELPQEAMASYDAAVAEHRREMESLTAAMRASMEPLAEQVYADVVAPMLEARGIDSTQYRLEWDAGPC